ncbi:MAG: hypothetical protein AAF943_15750 [Pseudomonadota bacterium]
MDQVTVFVRIGLYILAGTAARGGWLPEDIAYGFAEDPLLLELLAGGVIAGGTLVWYWFSQSRKALKAAVSR